MKITYAYWHSKQSTMVYAVKLAEQHGERIVIGAVGPFTAKGDWELNASTLPQMPYEQTSPWLARVLDDHQDEYEEVTP